MPFVERTSKQYPSEMWDNPFWYDYPTNVFFDSYYCLPNCTCYAWGRILELGGENLTLCHGNAGDWYGYTQDGYQRGSEPRLGAVACWFYSGSIGNGHVAVVEQIDGTDIIISDSDFRRPDQCNGDKLIKGNVYYQNAYWSRTLLHHPYHFGNYHFQGFIYVPITGGTVPPEPASWYNENVQLTDAERDSNAIKFYYRMSALGFSYNSIIAMLANIQYESDGVNPGRWQYGFTPFDQNAGYGLTQWTPYTKYANWFNRQYGSGYGWVGNGDAECQRIYYESRYGIDQFDADGCQWFANLYAPNVGYPVNPPITFVEFAQSSADYNTLADYWTLYYEHPAESELANRLVINRTWTVYFNNLLGGGTPPSPTPTPKPVMGVKNTFMLNVNKRKFMEKRGIIWR